MSDPKKGSSNDLDTVIDRAVSETGGDRAELEALIRNNPQFEKMFRNMRPQDFAKLKQVLNNPALARRILATPQAQQLLSAIQKKGNNS